MNEILNYTITDNLNITDSSLSNQMNCWDYWQRDYYPQIIQSYPVYMQHRVEDKGKSAFEIIKHLQDKKLMKLDKVSDFIDAMDILIKIL